MLMMMKSIASTMPMANPDSLAAPAPAPVHTLRLAF
jgi:hypothetical protein